MYIFYIKIFLPRHITDLSKTYFIKKSSIVVLFDGSYVSKTRRFCEYFSTLRHHRWKLSRR